MPCVYLPGPAPAVTVANTNIQYISTIKYNFHELRRADNVEVYLGFLRAGPRFPSIGNKW